MKKTQLTSILLLILIIGTVITSCSSQNTAADVTMGTTAETTVETTAETDYLDIMGEKQLNGMEYKVLAALDHPDLQVIMPEESMNGNVINDAYYIRDTFIEDKYGIDISYEVKAPGSVGAADLVKSITAGDTTFNIMIGPIIGTINTVATSGCLYNLLDVPYLSLNSNLWWNTMLCEKLQLNGKFFYTSGDIAAKMYSSVSATFANMKLLADYGKLDNPSDIYKYVYDGKWTYDTLYDLSKDTNQDLNNDSIFTAQDDFFGFLCENKSLSTESYVTACDLPLSTVNSDGKLIVDLNNETTINVIEKLKKVVMPIKYDTALLVPAAFAEDRALFFSHFLGAPTIYFREMESPFAILPMPKYDEKQESYRSLVNAWSDCFIAVPLLCGDADMVGYITEALAYKSYELIRPAFYETTLKEKMTRDSESAAMIDIIIDSACSDFNTIFNFGGTCELIYKSIMGKSDFVSSYTKIENKINASIDELNKIFYAE